MAITISANGNTVGGLFNSMNYNFLSNSSSNMFSGLGMGGFSFSDYASIRNGSYHKLLSSYYALDSTDTGTKTSSSSKTGASGSTTRTYHYWTPDGMIERTYDNSNVTRPKTVSSSTTATSKDKTSKLATIESDAEKLNSAANTLLASGTDSLFKQVTTTDKDGNKTTGYNTDAIYKAVNNYVSSYNAAIKSAGESNVMAIRTSAASMNDYTRNNKDLLASVGISYDSEKKTLSVDEKAFKEADMETVKKLFQGTTSYAYQVSSKASAIDSHAHYEASKASTYNSVGNYSYNYSSGSLWNSMI